MASRTQDNGASWNCTPEALVALSRAVTTARLLSGVVHEVNNALLVISGTVELLDARTDIPEQARRPLERLRSQSGRMAAAVAQVTAFTQARAEAGRVDLAELARIAVDLRRFAVSRSGLTIELNGATAPCPVSGNAAALQQALVNLIITAEHALAGTRGHISVDAATSGPWATVRVSDDRARPSDVADTLFDPFGGAGGPSDMSGLNLFAARVITEAHGGVLSVEANGAGTSFIVRIPALTVAKL